jgi:hypothetical protein
LLDAEDGEIVEAGSLNLVDIKPGIRYGTPKIIRLVNCDEILIGSHRVENYFNWLHVTTYMAETAIVWRDTTPTHYRLRKSSDIPSWSGSMYIDGTDKIDYPDFHSVDVTISGAIAGWDISAVTDRFGNFYLVTGPSAGPGLPVGLAYTEGYVCSPGAGDSCFTQFTPLNDPDPIIKTITGPCYSRGGAAGIGGMIVTCSSSGNALVFSIGLSLYAGASGTVGLQINQNTEWGWNSHIYERLNGTTLADLRSKAAH